MKMLTNLADYGMEVWRVAVGAPITLMLITLIWACTCYFIFRWWYCQKQAGNVNWGMVDEVLLQGGSLGITPEMIQAGVAEFVSWDESEEYAVEVLVSRIFRRMSEIGRQSARFRL